VGNLGQAQWLVNAALVASQWRALNRNACFKEIAVQVAHPVYPI